MKKILFSISCFFIFMISISQEEKIDTIVIINKIKEASDLSEKEPEHSKKTLNEILLLCEKHKFTKGIADAYYELGQIEYLKRNYNESINFTQKALEHYKQLDDNNDINITYYNLGIFQLENLEYLKANETITNSLKYIKDNPTELIEHLILLGKIQNELEDYMSAQSYYKKAIDIAKQHNNLYYLSFITLGLAETHMYLNEVEKAFNIYQDIEQNIAQVSNISKDRRMFLYGNLYNGFAKWYLKNGSLLQALKYAKKAKLNSIFYGIYVDSEILLGEIYFKLKDYNNSEIHLTSALKELQTNNKPDLEYKAKISLILSQIYTKRQKYNKAYSYVNAYRQLNDTISQIKNLKIEKNLILKFENERKDKILEQQKAKLQEQKIQSLTNISFYTIAIVIIGGLAFIVVGLQQRKTIKESKVRVQDKSNFLNAVTHELRTPLNAISIISHLLKSEGLTSPHIDTLTFSSNYLLSYVNNVISFNFSNKKEPMVLHKSKFNVKDTLKNIAKTTMLNINNNTFKMGIDDNIPKYIVGDELKLSQILINLLNNANKYTKDGSIELKTSLKNKTDEQITIAFSVSDTGIGILQEEREKIFDKFYQGSRKFKGNYDGSGLGLTIVKGLIALHNSNITLDSEVNKGTTFRFDITYDMPEDNILSESLKP